ncbi:MAG: hypothetical protein K0S32_646 [Bacteroidetes bacterium]|jgi:hypothetical protein|nr:hypothetical protein [Bacteroidota bacterium]
MLRNFILFLFIISVLQLNSQNSFTARYVGLTVHPFGDDQSSLQPYKLDKRAFFVANFGGIAGYEHYVWEDILSLKIMQGAFLDCSGGWAAVTHFGFRAIIKERKKHRLMFGMGPTFYYREDWNRFPGYEDKGFFGKTSLPKIGNIQYKLFLYGCEFEYDYSISNKTDLNVGFTPGFPLAMIFSVGIKHWFSKDFKKKETLVIPKQE